MMRRPQWAGPRISMLEQAIRRFQDRWETNRQFRAMASGVIGLVMIVALCSCMGVVTTVANSALAGFSAARDSGTTGNTNTGTGLIKGVPTFPTSTVPAWQQSGVPPYSIIPNSQTPVPGPTQPPTATPGDGGPGGPGGPTTCSRNKGQNSWALTPCPQVHSQRARSPSRLLDIPAPDSTFCSASAATVVRSTGHPHRPSWMPMVISASATRSHQGRLTVRCPSAG